MVTAKPRQIRGVPRPDEQGRGRMLLFLVWRGDSGIFFSRTFEISSYKPSGQILGATELVDDTALASFLGDCQFRFGGIAKAPGEHPGGLFGRLSLQVHDKTPYQIHTTRISLLRRSPCSHHLSLQKQVHGPSKPWIP